MSDDSQATKNQVIVGMIYTYKRRTYLLKGISMMKCTLTREWVECADYVPVVKGNISDTLCHRPLTEFRERFKVL